MPCVNLLQFLTAGGANRDQFLCSGELLFMRLQLRADRIVGIGSTPNTELAPYASFYLTPSNGVTRTDHLNPNRQHHHRSNGRPSDFPTSAQSKIDPAYQIATKGRESSGQCRE